MIIDDFTTDPTSILNYSSNAWPTFEILIRRYDSDAYSSLQSGGDTAHIWSGRRKVRSRDGEVLIAGDGKLVWTARRRGMLRLLYQAGDPTAGAVAGVGMSSLRVQMGTCAQAVPFHVYVGSFLGGTYSYHSATLASGSDNEILAASFRASGASLSSIGWAAFGFEAMAAGVFEIELLELN